MNHNTYQSLNQDLQIINLSHLTLSSTLTHVLQKGLSFVPSKTIDHFSTIGDVHLFARKLLLKLQWEKNGQRGDIDFSQFDTKDFKTLKILLDLWDDPRIEDKHKILQDIHDLWSENLGDTITLPSCKKKSSRYPHITENGAIDTFVRRAGPDWE